jgi:hypothetical protein
MLPYVPGLPWDFVIFGVPISSQAKSSVTRNRWKEKVRFAAQEAWPAGDPPLEYKIQIDITFYHDSTRLDVDNILKLIQDALIGIVYTDDKLLTDTHGHLRDINEAYRVRGMTPALAQGFVSDRPFVHIRIKMPPAVGELP